jgi:serine/threonine-protein kinase
MAPEQALGDAVDARVDLYAWGVLAYELLAGTHPFAGRVTAQQLVAAHIAEAPPPLEVRAPGVPRALATLVMRCLAKAPADRPQSATELLAAFDDGRSAERDLGGARGAPARRTGRRTVLGLGLTGLVLVLGAAGLAWRAAATRTASAASTAARGASDPASAGALQALAVLPFATVGGDTANAYFAEGMADELSNALAKVPALRLRGRGSLRRLREASAQEVGRALGVDGIITGSVRRAGGRLRVSVQLADASTGLVRWSDSYEREARDVFAVQDDITRAVVEALRVTLAGGAPRAGEASGRGTTSAEAYDLYLRALYLYQRRGSGLRQAEDYLEQAIGRDPSFARANALLALVLLVKPYYVPVGPADILPRASAAAQRAVALDSALADAHAALGTVLTTSSRWSGAEAEFRRALALDPTTAETHLRYGTMLLFLGRIREGLAALERARALDPLSPVIAAYLGHALALAGRLDESLVEGRRALDLDPTGVATYGNLVLDYVAAGRLADAVALTRRLRPSFRNVHYLGLYGYVFGRAGARAEALETLRALDSLPPTTFRIHSARARVHLGLDDTASALTALERAADTGGELLPGTFSLSDPMYDPVRRSARFAALLRRYDLDPRIFTAATGGRLP